MKSQKWLVVCAAGLFALASSFLLAQGNGNGHGKDHGKDHEKHGDDDQQGGYYKDHDRDIRNWYGAHQDHLPPRLAKRDQLPPGLEKQLVRRGTLPPGLQERIQPCPPDLEQRLPPPPPESAHVIIGGHMVLLNRRTNVVIDIFHLE
jgi:hypothetical protein